MVVSLEIWMLICHTSWYLVQVHLMFPSKNAYLINWCCICNVWWLWACLFLFIDPACCLLLLLLAEILWTVMHVSWSKLFFFCHQGIIRTMDILWFHAMEDSTKCEQQSVFVLNYLHCNTNCYKYIFFPLVLSSLKCCLTFWISSADLWHCSYCQTFECHSYSSWAR